MSSVKNSQSEARDFCVQPMREERNCGYPGSRSSRFCVNSKDTDCGYRYPAIKVMVSIIQHSSQLCSNLTLIFIKHIPFPLYLNPLFSLQRFEKYDLKVLRRIMNPIDILELFWNIDHFHSTSILFNQNNFYCWNLIYKRFKVLLKIIIY